MLHCSNCCSAAYGHCGSDAADPADCVTEPSGIMERTYKTPVEYTWNLSAEQPSAYRPAGYEFGFAEPGEATMIAAVLVAGTYQDPLVTPSRAELTQQIAESIRAQSGANGIDYLVARHRKAIVAVVAVTSVPGRDGHLPSGIAVEPEHHNQGLERYLLRLALLWLREMGVSEARGYAEAGSLSDRATYPYFGGRRRGVTSGSKRPDRSRRMLSAA